MALVLDLIHYDILLQHAAAILLMNATSLLQNESDFLLINATGFFNFMRVITKCVDFIPKCGSYCKLRRLLQNAQLHLLKLKR